MALPARKLSSFQLPIGTNTATGNPLALSGEWLKTGLHCIGPTGCGKSMLLFWIFQLLTKIPNATICLFDPKGSLYRMARDWAIGHGLTPRLVLFDLAESDTIIGYSSLKPNGQPITTQVKFARESFRSAWGQSSFDETPQLARILFMILFVARTLELGLLEALNLLRPKSRVREMALAKLPLSYIREALEYFDSLPERRQEELSASTLARLEPFVADPLIARTIKQQESTLDLADVYKRHKLLLTNLEHYKPLLPDDSRLLGRMLLNDVVAHAFERSEKEQDPIFLIVDEVQEIATRDLCAALDRGRGLGLHCLLAHQHCAQLMEDDKTGYLFQSVMNDARTKIVFSSSAYDLEHHLVKELLIDQFDPWTVKDELMNLECEPIEETRTIITKSESHSHGHATARPESISASEAETRTEGRTISTTEGESESVSQATSKGRTRGTSVARSMSEMQAEHQAETDSETQSWADTAGTTETGSAGTSQASVSGSNRSRSYNFTIDPAGDITRSYGWGSGWNSQGVSGKNSSRSTATTASHTDGGSAGHTSMRGGTTARTRGTSRGENESESESETITKTTGKSRERGRSASVSKGETKGKTVTHGVTPSESEEWGESESVTTSPFHAYRKRRVVSSRTFLTEQEFLTLGLQRIKEQPRGHFVIKVPGKPAVFARAPFINPPRVTSQQLARARERIFAQPYYTRISEIEVEGATQPALPYREAQQVNEHHHATRDPYTKARKPKRTKTPPAS